MTRDDQIVQSRWRKAATRRRLILAALVILPTIFAAQVMFTLLPPTNGLILKSILTALFALLFGWISIGFWSSLAGVMALLRRYDRFSLTTPPPEDRLTPAARTAILFPIYNEDSRRVAEGIRTVWQSLR